MKKPKVNRDRLIIEAKEDIDVPEGEIKNLIKYLQGLYEEYSALGWEEIVVVQEWEGYEDNYFELELSRRETQSEHTVRIEKEEKELDDWLIRQNAVMREKKEKDLVIAKEKKQKLLKELHDLETGVLSGL